MISTITTMVSILNTTKESVFPSLGVSTKEEHDQMEASKLLHAKWDKEYKERRRLEAEEDLKKMMIKTTECLDLLREGKIKEFGLFYVKHLDVLVHDDVCDVFWKDFSTAENIETLLNLGVRVCRPYGFLPKWFMGFFNSMFEKQLVEDQTWEIVNAFFQNTDSRDASVVEKMIYELLVPHPKIIGMLRGTFVNGAIFRPKINKALLELSEEKKLSIYEIVYGDDYRWTFEYEWSFYDGKYICEDSGMALDFEEFSFHKSIFQAVEDIKEMEKNTEEEILFHDPQIESLQWKASKNRTKRRHQNEKIMKTHGGKKDKTSFHGRKLKDTGAWRRSGASAIEC